MKKAYRKAACLLLCICLFSFSACLRQGMPRKLSAKAQEEKIQIGVTFDSFIIERWQRDRDVFVAAAQELGAQVNVQNTNGDMKEQIAQIDYFIQKGMDVIVVVMVASDEDRRGLVDAVGRAQKAGIPVVAYDRLILDANVDLYISFDNGQVGRLMGEHMREHLGGEGEILQVCGPLADYNVPQVMAGFDQAVRGEKLKVVKTEYAKSWLAETGFTATAAYLSQYPPPGGIMAGHDSIAGNVIRALSEQRLAGKVCVVGQDADLDACQRIAEGTQCMTVYKPVEKLARRAAEMSVALAKGEPLDVQGRMDDGTYEVPYECLEPEAVTRENMDEVITGKYHEESDIYLNVRKQGR